MAENLFLALVAAFAGLLAGWRAAPLISNFEADLDNKLAHLSSSGGLINPDIPERSRC